MAKRKTRKLHRDARTERFVTPETAKRRPGTTVTETIPIPKRSKPRKRKIISSASQFPGLATDDPAKSVFPPFLEPPGCVSRSRNARCFQTFFPLWIQITTALKDVPSTYLERPALSWLNDDV